MNDIRRTNKCSRCAQDFEFIHLRYAPDGLSMVCRPCLGMVEKEIVTRQRETGKLYTFQCIGCHYQFRRSAQNAPVQCPQCGKGEFLKAEKERLDANTVLKMADDPRLEFLD